MESKADANKLSYVGSKDRRNSDTWFTPSKYVDSVRVVLGGVIWLDPFSSESANELVKAVKYFGEEDDAFVQSWDIPQGVENRTAFMNPPYTAQIVKPAVNKFVDVYVGGGFDSGVLLVNNATETSWFQRALGESSGVCFPGHRIAFWNVDGKAISGNTRGQAFLYFGGDVVEFCKEFSQYGFVTGIGARRLACYA